jgi:hypothetical protein
MMAFFYVVPFLKASPWRSSRPLFATSGGNLRSVGQMTAMLMCRTPLEGVILRGVHRLEGPVDGICGGAAFPMTHQRRGVSATRRNKVSATDA